jgi:hypothetical protein
LRRRPPNRRRVRGVVAGVSARRARDRKGVAVVVVECGELKGRAKESGDLPSAAE